MTRDEGTNDGKMGNNSSVAHTDGSWGALRSSFLSGIRIYFALLGRPTFLFLFGIYVDILPLGKDEYSLCVS